MASPRRRFGKRSAELGLDRRHGLAALAHLQALADAQDHVEAGGERGLGLGADFVVGLPLRLPPFAMADDGQRSAGVGKHRRRGAAGVRSFVGKMHVLPADREAGDGADRALDQDRRDAQRDVDRRNEPDASAIAAISPRSAATPCIFQLPATSFFNAIVLYSCPSRA